MNVEQLIQYYTDLLIIQYFSKPKARETIRAYIQNTFMGGLPIQVRDAFDVETAVGKQLDIIGKYVGIDRSYSGQQFGAYFSFVNYIMEEPFPSEYIGFSTYDDFDDKDGEHLTYDDIINGKNNLDDDDYRFLIKLKIILNQSNFSYKELSDALFTAFGEDIFAESDGNMEMIYYVPRRQSTIIQVAIQKKVLPKPMAVRIKYLIEREKDLFMFADYSNLNEVNGFTGFSTYADFDTKQGEHLTYNKLIEV